MSRQVTLRQEAGLRAALAHYQDRADRAQAEAERVARSRRLQRALERHDRAKRGGKNRVKRAVSAAI
jgi:hypothetical protein